jgi:UDP-N-acetylmuramoyl-tripeptide--D-alanyl-D-alanine ligase
MDPRPVTWVLEAVGNGSNGCATNASGGCVTGVSTDSRLVREGDLYVALEGEKFDGHDFVGSAFANGAAAALISRDIDDLGGVRDRPVIRVADTKKALGKLAAAHRRTLQAKIIAVTGSNGKTTVKDLVAHLLAGKGRVVKAPKSFNNDIGLPLTLLAMDGRTRFGVVEMGTSAPGEIAELSRIAAPDFGVVTNVGPAHLEGLGGIQGVAEEKAALVEALPESGMAFLNYEDYHCREMVRLANCPAATFAFDPSADIWGLKRCRVPGGISFYLYGKMEMKLGVHGLEVASVKKSGS